MQTNSTAIGAYRTDGTTPIFIAREDGNVGIGTSSPTFTAGSGLEISRAGPATLRLEDTDGTTGATELVQVDADFFLLTRQSSSLIFGVNSSEKIRINTSGSLLGGITAQVGIGGTPADANSFELSRGYLNLARDDTSNAKQITFGKNGAVHSYIETTSSGLNLGLSANNLITVSSTNQVFRVEGENIVTFESDGVTIAGDLSKTSGSFKIDHPLKPETHHLVHSFVEGPQADNLYRGVIKLNKGKATIDLDDWFGMTAGTFLALNRDIQAFVNNSETWDAVRANVQGSQLIIECQNSDSNAEVSWLVIGERQDKEIHDSSLTDDNGKIIIEPEKT